MKALLLIAAIVAMGFFLFKQQGTISTLQSSLADAQAKSAQLQTELDNAKQTKDVTSSPPPVYTSPLVKGTVPPPATGSDWMWKKKTVLDPPK